MSLSKGIPERDRHHAAPWRSWLLLRRCATPALGGASGSKLKRLTRPAPSSHAHAADCHAILGESLSQHPTNPHGHAAYRLVIRPAPLSTNTGCCAASPQQLQGGQP